MKQSKLFRKNILFLPILILLSLMMSNFALRAESFDTKGTDFRFTFLPNFHSAGYEKQDSVYIYLTSDEPTTVTVTITNSNNTVLTKEINVSDNSQVYSISLYHYKNELIGNYNNDYLYGVDRQSNSEEACPIGVHITSPKEINVYGLSTSTKSSDAFMVFPTDVLGTEYYVMAYTSDWIGSYTPSQFAIVATEDNTEVYITPACRTTGNMVSRFKITLNAGESYLMQSYRSYQNTDLTGSYITSDKKIAVFGGQQRASVPTEMGDASGAYSSRDMLCAQVPPLHTWGRNAFVIPFPQPESISNEYNDVYRILSATDNNIVDIDGRKVTINRGEVIEQEIFDKPISISAQEPILVAQYKRSSESYQQYQRILLSDPLFLILPPKEQFIREASLMNMQKFEENKKVFRNQYIVIVAPNVALQSCKMDNINLGTSNFSPINNSDYSYYVMQTTDGIHHFSSNDKCGLYVLGYGDANSYGYVGGMEMKDVRDTIPPAISYQKECFKLVCTINDETGDTEGLMDIQVLQEYLKNVKINLPTDYYGKTTASFSAELIDPSKDGIYSIKIIDIQNNVTIISDTIQGKTLKFDYQPGKDNVIDSVTIGTQICKKISATNTGILPYNISIGTLRLSDGKYFSIPPSQFPLIVNPGETKDLIVCTNPTIADEELLDTLQLAFDCYSLEVPLKATTIGVETKTNTNCGLPVNLTLVQVIDALLFDNISTDDNSKTAKLIFGIPQPNAIKIVLFDIEGNKIQELFSGDSAKGLFEFEFSYQNIPSGAYFIKLESGSESLTRKFIINQ